MTDPANGALTGIAIATGAVTLTGSIFGLQYEALLFGLFGGLISLMHVPPMSIKRLAGTLGTSTLFGGVATPIVMGFLNDKFTWLAAVPETPARDTISLLLGLFAQAAIPMILHAMDRWAHKGDPQ